MPSAERTGTVSTGRVLQESVADQESSATGVVQYPSHTLEG